MTISSSPPLALQAFHWNHLWRIGLSIAVWTIGSCAAAELLGYRLHGLLDCGAIQFLNRNPMKHRLVLHGPLFMDKNFGIGFFLFDRLLGTLKMQQPPFNHRGYAVATEKFNYLEEQRAPRTAWLNTNEDTRTKDNDAVLGKGTQDIPW